MWHDNGCESNKANTFYQLAEIFCETYFGINFFVQRRAKFNIIM